MPKVPPSVVLSCSIASYLICADMRLVHISMNHHTFLGQHYIVHFSSRSPTDYTYTDAMDVHALMEDVVDPEDPDNPLPGLIYGATTGAYSWSKTDHCQFVNQNEIVSPVRDATTDVKACHADMTDDNMNEYVKGYLGINVVPAANPDVVPDSVKRDVEEVNPVCVAGCSPLPEDSSLRTSGYCRLATADPNVAVCAAPTRVHKVAWANPVLSGVEYDVTTVAGAKPGEYIEFEWDDVVHDVWLVPSDVEDPCDTSSQAFIDGATLLIPPSHHATISQETEDTVVDGRNRFQIPLTAGGTTLLFVCTVNGHCRGNAADSNDDDGDAGNTVGGMQLSVAVSSTLPTSDSKLAEGLCAEGFKLCPDQSKQTETVATVATSANVPFTDMIGAETLRLEGKETFASTPWNDFKYRKVVGKVCQQRAHNTRVSSRAPSVAGTDHGWHGNHAVWDFADHTLRDVVEACSTSHPEMCTGISWKGKFESDGGDGSDMFTGKHVFRRCLNTDRYTRVINVGALTPEEAKEYSYTHPKHFVKSVDCPSCYECREMPLTPNSGPGNVKWEVYGKRAGIGFGFNIKVSNAGQPNAVLTVSMPEPVTKKGGAKAEAGYELTWGEHNPEFLCRIDPTTAGPAEPDLIEDDGWTTFLLPDDTEEGGGNEGGDPNHDDVIDVIAAGFHPPEAVRDFESIDQANLAALYPPGAQVDPSVTDGPWHSRETESIAGWNNRSSTALKFTLPATTLDNGRGGGYWPPKPTFKVSFMPIPVEGEGHWRWYPKLFASFGAVTKLREETTNLGWHIDGGAIEAYHTQSETGETMQFGWRCPARIGWFDSNWNEKNAGAWPAFVHGAAKDVGNYFQASTGVDHARCPDGQLNVWEATVPNGVYTVTAGLTSGDSGGCTFENVRVQGYTGHTVVYSVEVADGKFTMSSAPPLTCQAVSWVKLDLLSSKVYPKPWLPAPPKAWWQLEMADATADIGMVEVRLPHEGFMLASTYPFDQEWSVPDCRQWWLYAPAKCYRMFMSSRKPGVHPEMVTYPNFPGFSEPFLQWYFDQHDTDGNGELFYEEFRAAQAQEALTGNYSMWKRPAPHNKKGTPGYHDDNAKHLWIKLNVIHPTSATITKDEWVHGMLSQPRKLFCDLFESTALTHGGNLHDGSRGGCKRDIEGPRLPEQLGYFNDDGAHGFLVTVSDTPCTDQDGCPTATTDGSGGGSTTTVCEFRTYRSSESPATVNCGGAKGKYIQISLPGEGQRLMPTLFVTAHRASVALLPGTDASTATASTNPKLQTVCYGLKPRPPPAANDPDLLAAAKIHPKTIVKDNPEDPIFWSTCYDRVVIKDWLPLINADDDEANYDRDGVPYIFNNGTYCLDCDSVQGMYGATITRDRFTNYNADKYVYDFIMVARPHADATAEALGLRIADIAVDGVRVNASQVVVHTRNLEPNSNGLIWDNDTASSAGWNLGGQRLLGVLSGANNDSALNLAACIGECDADAQCAAGLKCFERSSNEAVPGCAGNGGAADWDYCYDPGYTEGSEHIFTITTLAPVESFSISYPGPQFAPGWKITENGNVFLEESANRGSGEIQLSGSNNNGAKNLNACIGECDADAQCVAGLKCFQRSSGEAVPGCTGNGGAADWDYCYDPLLDSNTTVAYKFEVQVGGRDYDMDAMRTPRWWLQEKGMCQNCDAVVFGIHTSTTTSTSTTTTTSTSTSSQTIMTVINSDGDDVVDTLKCAGLYCGGSKAEVEAATLAAVQAALAAAGVDVNTAGIILAEMQSTVDLSSLATAAATGGLAAAFASGTVATILIGAGLDDAAVAAVAAAATAAEVDAVNSDGDANAAPPSAKTNGGAVAGGIVAALVIVGVLVGGVLVYRSRQANAAIGDTGSSSSSAVARGGTSYDNPTFDQGEANNNNDSTNTAGVLGSESLLRI